MYNRPMGVGFNDSAPAVHPHLEELPPPMAAEVSAGMDQRFLLDSSSFEKLLAAAWVLQCLQDQLQSPQAYRDEPIAELVKANEDVETAKPDIQAVMLPVLSPSPRITEPDSKDEPLNSRPADDATLSQLVETQQTVENGTLNFEAAVKIEVETAEIDKTVEATDAPHAVTPSVLANPTNDHDKEWAGRRAAFSLQTAFNRTQDPFRHLLPSFRIHLTLRALRAVAIATPVWLLSLVAALLFLEVWRHESLHSAQASRPTPPTVEASASNIPPTVTTTNPRTTALPISAEVKRADVSRSDNQRTWTRTPPPLEVSHRRVTDPATLSATQQLSPYELKGLRRRARYGDDSAAFTLGMAYEIGRFVPQNCVEATRWVTTAAEAGDAAAQYNLGLRYRDGDGVRANRAESVKWLRKAARRNRQAKLALNMRASR